MRLFDRLRKKNPPVEETSGDTDTFHQLLNLNISEIWKLENQNSFVIAISGWLGRKCQYGTQLDILTPEEKTIYIVDNFQSEVHNGGFLQYLYNSSGAFVHELSAALSAIGATQTAQIYQEALECLPIDLPADDVQRESVLDSLITQEISAVFSACDSRFYAYPDDLEALIYQFIKSHRDSFVPS